MSSRIHPFCAIIVVAATPWTTAAPQSVTGRVLGAVIDATSRTAVADAEIVLVSDRRTVVSDSLGRFAFANLPSGIVRFVVRAPGFPLTRVAVALTIGETLLRQIELDSTVKGRSAAQALPAVALVAPAPPAPRYVDFERRRQNGRGQYLGEEDLQKGVYSSLQDAMRGLRGVNVECGGGGGCSIRMVRAPMRCSPEYIVDERVDNMFGQTTPIRDIKGIEVYTGPSDVPGEFAGRNAGCGVIVIWTRAGPSRPKQ